MDYLKGFTTRQDIYALEGQNACYHRKNHQEAGENATRFVRSNPEAFHDLDVGGVLDKVFAVVPRQYEKGRVRDREYMDDIFHNPVNGLKSLQDASNIVEFVLSIRRMREPVSKRLKRVKDLGARFDADERFREAEKFITALYLPYKLGDVIDDNMDYLHSISSVGSRREFYGGNRIILEATEKMLTEEPFVQFINDEARALNLLKTMKSKLDIWHKDMFSFNLSGIKLETWGKNERKRYGELMEYWLLLVNEAVYSRIPKLEIGDLSPELSFYLGAGSVQRKWTADGFTVTTPTVLEKREIRASIPGSCNTSLIERINKDRIIRNDIASESVCYHRAQQRRENNLHQTGGADVLACPFGDGASGGSGGNKHH